MKCSKCQRNRPSHVADPTCSVGGYCDWVEDRKRCIKLDVRIDLKPDEAPQVTIDTIYSPLPEAFLEELAALVQKHSATHAEPLLDPSMRGDRKFVRLP